MKKFKMNQTIVCIDNNTMYDNELTIGNKYIIIDIIRDGGIFINSNKSEHINDGLGVCLVNDMGYACYYNPNLFIDMITCRTEIINNILDEF